MSTTKTGARSRANGKPDIATLDDLRATREVVALLPSGYRVRIRPPNMELHALSGGLPSRLRRLATVGAPELNRMLSNREEADEALLETRDYLVAVVREMVIDPDLSSLRTFEELDAILLPADFHFLLEIGQRERDYDAEGKRLWGIEPLGRWETFRDVHGCAEDCPACLELQRRYSMAATG